MRFFKRGICFFLAGIVMAALASCRDQTVPYWDIPSEIHSFSSSNTATSLEDTSSMESGVNTGVSNSNASSNTNSNHSGVDSNHSSYIQTDGTTDPEPIEEYVDTDGDFSYQTVEWNGPEGYRIIVPSGNDEAFKAAEQLQKYFIGQSNVTLPIYLDTSVANTSKEILVGATNRSQSNKKLNQGYIEVSLKGDKLVFEGGHNVTVRAAVDKYLRLAPKKGEAAVFRITTDFKATLDGGYIYYWGDEFEGDDIDFSKWTFDKSMAGSDTIALSYDKDVANCEDGRLKLHAYRNTGSGAEFRLPYCLSTVNNMNYTYGYVEIRARVPACKGAFPAWWAKSTSQLGGKRNSDYMTEIDIFEAFGSEIRCTLHKWYKGLDFDRTYGLNAGQHTDLNSRRYRGNYNLTYAADNYRFFSYQYHVYGFEWTPQYMAMSVDGQVYSKIDITKSYDENPDPSGFHDTIFLIFDNFVLDEPLSGSNATIYQSLDELPTCFYIDYIRLYQKPGVGVLKTSDKVNTFPTRK